jgi:hypothetical protein
LLGPPSRIGGNDNTLDTRYLGTGIIRFGQAETFCSIDYDMRWMRQRIRADLDGGSSVLKFAGLAGDSLLKSPFSAPELSSASRSSPASIINTSGCDFRKGQQANNHRHGHGSPERLRDKSANGLSGGISTALESGNERSGVTA